MPSLLLYALGITIIQSATPTHEGSPDESARLVEEHPVFNLVLEGGAKQS